MNFIRLVVVDDSLFIRKAITRLFETSSIIKVIATASTGEDLIENIKNWRPDIIILDLFMPGIGGIKTLEILATEYPDIPVIVMSTHSQKDAPITIESLYKGAVDFIDKQEYSLVDFERLRNAITEKILSIVSNKNNPSKIKIKTEAGDKTEKIDVIKFEKSTKNFDIIAIGASTGGPPVIQTILEDIEYSPVPIVVVQHMPVGFTRHFAERLDKSLALNVLEANNDMKLSANTCYIAPSGFHLEIIKKEGSLFTMLSENKKKYSHCPSVDVLFFSLSDIAEKVIAVLLTGMGDDGARGMKKLYDRGAYTIAQDEATSIIFGMPRVAIECQAVKEILPYDKIGKRLKNLLYENS